MTQYNDADKVKPFSGSAVAAAINKISAAIRSGFSGAARPSFAQAGMPWVKIVSSTNYQLMMFDGSQDILLFQFNPETNSMTDANAFMKDAGLFSSGFLNHNRLEKPTDAEATAGVNTTKFMNSAKTRIAIKTQAMTLDGAQDIFGTKAFNDPTYFKNQLIMNGHSVNLSQGADVASATELLLLRDGNIFNITGTTTITSIETTADAWPIGSTATFRASDAFTLTHHVTNLILKGASDIPVVAGDTFEMQKYASGDWRMLWYQRADGTALVSSGSSADITLLFSSGPRKHQGTVTLSEGMSNFDEIQFDMFHSNELNRVGTHMTPFYFYTNRMTASMSMLCEGDVSWANYQRDSDTQLSITSEYFSHLSAVYGIRRKS